MTKQELLAEAVWWQRRAADDYRMADWHRTRERGHADDVVVWQRMQRQAHRLAYDYLMRAMECV